MSGAEGNRLPSPPRVLSPWADPLVAEFLGKVARERTQRPQGQPCDRFSGRDLLPPRAEAPPPLYGPGLDFDLPGREPNWPDMDFDVDED